MRTSLYIIYSLFTQKHLPVDQLLAAPGPGGGAKWTPCIPASGFQGDFNLLEILKTKSPTFDSRGLLLSHQAHCECAITPYLRDPSPMEWKWNFFLLFAELSETSLWRS